MTDKIIWKPVRGLEDAYEVSNTGLVRRKAYLLKPCVTANGGHLHLSLGLHRRAYVHRLVAEAFLPKPEPEKIWVNHKNGKPSDNVVENLEWCTPGENIAHGYWHNGRVNYNCRAVAAVNKDGEIVHEFKSMADAAKHVGVTYGAIRSAIDRKGKCKKLWWVDV
jgi:hypothetical protein